MLLMSLWLMIIHEDRVPSAYQARYYVATTSMPKILLNYRIAYLCLGIESN